MNVNNDNFVAITDANRNSSRVVRIDDEKASVVTLKNDSPRYMLTDFSSVEKEQTANNEDVLSISKHLIEKNRKAYEALER